MKILLLLSGLLFSGGLFADMDKVCFVVTGPATTGKDVKGIKDRCERNNILLWMGVEEPDLNSTIAQWCRMDREIKYHRRDVLNTYDLTCVLYSNEARALNYPSFR